MANRPFTSEYTNALNECVYNTVPAMFNSNNVLVSQAHNHKIFDTVTTTVADNLATQQQKSCVCPCAFSQTVPQIQVMQEFVPGGISFSFKTTTPQNYNFGGQMNFSQYQQSPEQPTTLQQQIVLKELEREGLELLLLQEYLKKRPYRLQFHQNGQTSTTDLLKGPSQVPISQGMPDFTNISGITKGINRELRDMESDRLLKDTPTSVYPKVSTGKKLLLTKSPDLQRAQQPSRLNYYDEEETEEKEVEEKGVENSNSDVHDKQTSTKRVSFEKNRNSKKKDRKNKNRRSFCIPKKKSRSRNSSHSSSEKCKDGAEDSLSSEDSSDSR